jgi:hypothetical protein
MALVIKEWNATRTPAADGVYVRIVGREAGLLSWFLSLVKVDPITTIIVTKDLVMFEKGSLAGFSKRVIPVRSICSAYYGYSKPWQVALALAVIIIGVLSSWQPLVGLLLGLIVGGAYYFLNKTLSLGFIENSGVGSGIEFKRSLIEGQNINEIQAKEVIDVVRELIEQKG